MRHHLFLSALVCCMAAGPAFAQSYPAKAVILQKDVEVRSGPSKNFFPTSKLNQNEEVLVLRESKEAPGWLEIKPPTGSFSWISGKYVKQVDARHGFVECDPTRPVSILPGSTLVNQAPNRESMKLTAGTVVVIVDRPMTVDGESWLPIQPHPSEVRYLPAEAVKPAASVTPASNSPPNWTRGPDGFSTNSALAEADQALKANDINRARLLYQQVANTATDQNQRVLAMNRLASLPTGASPPVPATTTSLSPTNATPLASPNLQTLKAPAWSTYGRLRDTKLLSENSQAIYGLEDAQGKILTYITTIPGKSLQAYIGRTVAVFGPTMYRPDVRMQYVVASHVAVP